MDEKLPSGNSKNLKNCSVLWLISTAESILNNHPKEETRMKINLRVRLRNPLFIAQIILAIFTPLLAYAGLTVQDLTTWQALGDLIKSAASNPYVLCLVAVSLWNAVNDPTTRGPGDSSSAMTYTAPKK